MLQRLQHCIPKTYLEHSISCISSISTVHHSSKPSHGLQFFVLGFEELLCILTTSPRPPQPPRLFEYHTLSHLKTCEMNLHLCLVGHQVLWQNLCSGRIQLAWRKLEHAAWRRCQREALKRSQVFPKCFGKAFLEMLSKARNEVLTERTSWVANMSC